MLDVCEYIEQGLHYGNTRFFVPNGEEARARRAYDPESLRIIDGDTFGVPQIPMRVGECIHLDKNYSLTRIGWRSR